MDCIESVEQIIKWVYGVVLKNSKMGEELGKWFGVEVFWMGYIREGYCGLGMQGRELTAISFRDLGVLG